MPGTILALCGTFLFRPWGFLFTIFYLLVVGIVGIPRDRPACCQRMDGAGREEFWGGKQSKFGRVGCWCYWYLFCTVIWNRQ